MRVPLLIWEGSTLPCMYTVKCRLPGQQPCVHSHCPAVLNRLTKYCTCVHLMHSLQTRHVTPQT